MKWISVTAIALFSMFFCFCKEPRKAKKCTAISHVSFRAPYIYPNETIKFRQGECVLKIITNTKPSPVQLEFETDICQDSGKLSLEIVSTLIDTIYYIKSIKSKDIFINLSIPYPKAFAGKKITANDLNYGYITSLQSLRQIVVEGKRTGIVY